MPDSLRKESTLTLHTLHTVWIYWADDDAIEMQGGIDSHTLGVNPDFYVSLLHDARLRVGAENVREIKIEVDWAEVCAAFDPPKIEGTVKP